MLKASGRLHHAHSPLGGFKPKQRVLVTGIGSGVAQFVAQFAVLAGGDVWVTSSSPDKVVQATQKIGVRGGFDVKDPVCTGEVGEKEEDEGGKEGGR